MCVQILLLTFEKKLLAFLEFKQSIVRSGLCATPAWFVASALCAVCVMRGMTVEERAETIARSEIVEVRTCPLRKSLISKNFSWGPKLYEK